MALILDWMKKVSVTVVIPAKQEASNLPQCLSALRWADELIVVDSGSVDSTREVATMYGADVVDFKFERIWPKKKNWFLENVTFRNEWVLIIDADEVLGPLACDEIEGVIARSGDTVAYWINRRFMFMGRWLKHAYYPNWNLRLFRHECGRYEKLSDSETQSGDNEIHEHIVVRGNTGRLNVEIEHYAFPDIFTFVEKHNRYSNWEARVFQARILGEGRQSFGKSEVRVRRKIKQWSQYLPFRPTLRFFYVYLLQKGFLDGVAGYYFARLHGFYEFLCVVKAAELADTAMEEKSLERATRKRAC